jgi:hypothetical protein
MRTAIRLARRLRGRPAIEIGSTEDETVLPAAMAIGCRSLARLNDEDPRAEIARRRSLFDRIVDDLRDMQGIRLLHDRLDDGTVPYGVPFRYDGEPTSALRFVERRHHVVIMQWPSLPGVIADSAPGHYTNVWLVNFL